MADVGCEIAATYNALKLRGRIIPCSSIIRSFEKDGYLLKYKTVGDWGSDPYAIGDYLDDNSINYTHNITAMERWSWRLIAVSGAHMMYILFHFGIILMI